MKSSFAVFTALSLLMLGVTAGRAHAWQYTVLTDFYSTGVYDENVVQSNAVDREAAGNPKSFVAFTNSVAAAYAGNRGGVCTWDNVAGWIFDSNVGVYTYTRGFGNGSSGRCGNHVADPADSDYFGPARIRYGAGWTNFIEFVPNDFSDVWPVLYEGYGGTIGRAVSGPSIHYTGAIMYPNGGGGGFGPHGFEPNWGRTDPGTMCVLKFLQPGIVELGFTALCSSKARHWDVYVTYDDDSTSEHRVADVAATEADAKGYLFQDDVFFQFSAPFGRTIKELRWDTDVDGSMIDDLAFVINTAPTHPLILIIY